MGASEVEENGIDIASLSWPILRVSQDKRERIDDPVVLEEPLEIIINEQRLAVLMRMPGQEKELAAGFCISEGYVRRPEDILLIHHCGLGLPAPGEEEGEDASASRNRVEVRVSSAGFSPPERADLVRLIRSGCGAADVSTMADTLPSLSQGFFADTSVLIGLAKATRDLQAVHRQVGGTHGAAIFDGNGRVIAVAEDIGRHNAVDKVGGYCLMRRIPLADKILVTTGRASYEMVTKTIRFGIPMVASMSAPTSLAVQLAQDRGLTLIGYLRGGRMNVYTHLHRVRDVQGNRRIEGGQYLP